MIETAGRLSGADIAALAGYLGTLPHATGQSPVRATPEIAPAALDAAGRLASAGDPARGLPGCSACHGAEMRGDFALAPRLDGQDEVYLKRRLDTFAEGREIAAYSPMRDIAAALTADERVALARWYAGNAGN
jgi:cytochrome c553